MLDIRLYNYEDTLKMKRLSKEESLNLYDISMHHIMSFTDVNLVDDKLQRWKVEDSYGNKEKIFDLENELGIDHKRNKYVSASLRFLLYKFGKSISAIHVALHRMRKIFPYPITFEDEGVICVKKEGVKWLYENYFKMDYLKELEKYKWELENRRNSLKFQKK